MKPKNAVATRDPYEVQEIAEEPKTSHGNGEGSLCAICLFAAKQKGNEKHAHSESLDGVSEAVLGKQGVGEAYA